MTELHAADPTAAIIDWPAVAAALDSPPPPPAVGAPADRLGLATLLGDAVRGRDILAHAPQLLARARDAADANALMDLALLLQLRFQRPLAMAVQRAALTRTQVYGPGAAPAGVLRVLVIKAPGDLMTNTPIECLLVGQPLAVTDLYLDMTMPWPETLPPHDLVFVAVSVSDRHRALLMRLSGYLRQRAAMVLNAPDLIQNLARDQAFRRVADIASVRMAETWRLSRTELMRRVSVSGLPPFPLIVRPVDSHAGTALERVTDTPMLADYLSRIDAPEYFLSEFVDYAATDGLYRKLRVVLIDGQPHVCHLGISAHWMVHYPYAEMLAEPARRDEEAAMLATPKSDFCHRHAAAFAALHQRFGLDYFGMDCAETRDGRLLIFEFANALVIHDFDDPQVFPYKSPAMQRTFAAFGDFLRRRARDACHV